MAESGSIDYRCATCGKRVAVIREAGKTDPTIIRACGHDGAGVTAGLTAVVSGKAKVSG